VGELMKASLTKDQLQNRIVHLENLPTLSSIAVEVIRRWNEPDLSIRAITEIVSRDPGLTAKLLQVANSSTFGLQKQVTSLNHAAALLGLNRLRCVTLGVTVLDTFSDKKAVWAEHIDLEEFWRHSLSVAVAAEMLAVRYGWASPEEAFLAGLLHDIGKIGLLAVVPEEYSHLLEDASGGDRALTEYESEFFNLTHAEVGKWLSEQWGFPEIFRNAIWLHHQTPSSEGLGAENPGGIVHLADHLARRARIGFAGNRFSEHDDVWLSEQCGFEAQELSEFTGKLLESVQEIGEELDLSIPTVDIYLKALEEANRILATGGMAAENELEKASERADLMAVLAEISGLRSEGDLEVDLLAKAVEKIRMYLKLPWILVMARDSERETLEGVVYGPQLESVQTFYRAWEEGEQSSGKEPGERSPLDALGETVLSSGQRTNLKDDVVRLLKKGTLLAIPLELDESCRGECFIDTTGSALQSPSARGYLEALLDATSGVYLRARLIRRLAREAEAAAQAARSEAEAHRELFHFERLASVGRLAAGAAHEINNPLAVISGKAQLLLSRVEDENTSGALQDIIGQTMRISKIISDLMGFARPTEPAVSDVELSILVENSLQMARHRLPKYKGVESVIKISEDLPCVSVDGRQIEQVLSNLFVNAMQAMGNSGSLTVQSDYSERTRRVSVRVTDTGPGIPPDDLGKIFDPFFTTKREGEGTGLGLAVSQRIVETHGGSLSVQSRAGKGPPLLSSCPRAEQSLKRLPRSHRKARNQKLAPLRNGSF